MAAQDPHATVVYIRALDGQVVDAANKILTRNDDDNDASCWLPLEECCLAELDDDASMESSLLGGGVAGQTASLPSQSQALPSSYFNDPSVLSRIQMHHVVCIRDVYHLLLSGTVLSSGSGRRTRLIVLDDLDRLFPSHQLHGAHHDPHMAISQLCK